jgi:hypothetical protein
MVLRPSCESSKCYFARVVESMPFFRVFDNDHKKFELPQTKRRDFFSVSLTLTAASIRPCFDASTQAYDTHTHTHTHTHTEGFFSSLFAQFRALCLTYCVGSFNVTDARLWPSNRRFVGSRRCARRSRSRCNRRDYTDAADTWSARCRRCCVCIAIFRVCRLSIVKHEKNHKRQHLQRIDRVCCHCSSGRYLKRSFYASSCRAFEWQSLSLRFLLAAMFSKFLTVVQSKVRN